MVCLERATNHEEVSVKEKECYGVYMEGEDIAIYKNVWEALRAYKRILKSVDPHPRYRPRRGAEPTTPELRKRLKALWGARAEVIRTRFVRKDGKPVGVVLLRATKPYTSDEECLEDFRQALRNPAYRGRPPKRLRAALSR